MLKIKEGFVIRNIVDEWIIVPVGQQEGEQAFIMSVNESGYLLWDMLEEGSSVEQLLAKMLEEYDIDEQTAREDIESFLDQLKEHNVI